MSHPAEVTISGGLRLKMLRESYGKTQLDVELDANLGIGYLQRLERGKVHQPEQDTLIRILDALGAGFVERREVCSLFGYAIPVTLPTAAEIQWAVNVFHSQVKDEHVPVYLLDCSHRLLAWNRQVKHLFGVLNTLKPDALLPRLIFDKVGGIAGLIINAETFFPAQVRIVHYERQRCGNGSLFDAFIDQMMTIPTFAKYWVKGDDSGGFQLPMRPLVPMKLDYGRRTLQFRLIAESFVQDPRFRVIYYLPDNSATLRQCLEWHG
ncbi:MAG: helix-turn-helix domain-containing protein [Anaerolineaceae bacterium]|nr:helix-turn-helix domain-containing protein [Anaerolineaceae bacterium]